MRSELQSTFQKQLHKRRMEKGLSQKELADKTGLSLKTVNTWESAKTINGDGPKAENLLKLCEVLDCSIDYLFSESDYPTGEHKSIHQDIGLSISAIDHLRMLNRIAKGITNYPSTDVFGQQYLDFYSAFICSYGIQGAIDLYGGSMQKLYEIEETGEQVDGIFSNESYKAFLRFQVQTAITQFIENYFNATEKTASGNESTGSGKAGQKASGPLPSQDNTNREV